jgi:hypothetical protein
VDEAAYGGNSRVGNRSDTHRVDVGLGPKHDRLVIRRQSKLESIKLGPRMAATIEFRAVDLCGATAR